MSVMVTVERRVAIYAPRKEMCNPSLSGGVGGLDQGDALRYRCWKRIRNPWIPPVLPTAFTSTILANSSSCLGYSKSDCPRWPRGTWRAVCERINIRCLAINGRFGRSTDEALNHGVFPTTTGARGKVAETDGDSFNSSRAEVFEAL